MHEIVKINFKMVIVDDDRNYEIQFHEEGKRFVDNKKTYISFKEPVTGNNSNQLTFICDENEITIIRNGFVRMKQIYKEKEHTVGYYNNENVSLEITTYTNKYCFSDDAIILNYDIIYDDSIVGNYQMEVNIRGVDTGEPGA